MKFNIYFGGQEELAKQKLIGTFDSLEKAEKDLLNLIRQNSPGREVKTITLNDTHRKYDLGDKNVYTIIRNVEVVAAAIIKEGKVFATQRGYGEFKDGWEFPGGKMEEGESEKEALAREIREELNAQIEVGDLIGTITYDYPGFHLTMHCYMATLSGRDPQLLEHEAACWVGKDEIDNINWLPADTEIVEKVKSLLK